MTARMKVNPGHNCSIAVESNGEEYWSPSNPSTCIKKLYNCTVISHFFL